MSGGGNGMERLEKVPDARRDYNNGSALENIPISRRPLSVHRVRLART